MAKEVTVIVPVYNVENYVAETINSLINQSLFANLEIILVEDYSTDNSLEICRKYEKIYDNIKVVQTKGKGLSDARNTGMDLVKTPYVMFIDSDDLFPHYTCFKMWNAIRKNKLDIVVGDLKLFPRSTPKYRWKKYFGNGDQILDIYGEGSDLIWYPSACTKIYRTSFLEKEKVRFKSGIHFEDAYTIVPLMIKTRYIGIVDAVIYKYRKREESTSIMDNMYKKQNFYDHLLVNENLIKYRKLSSSLNKSIQTFVVQTYIGFLNNFNNPSVGLSEQEKKELFNRLVILFRNVNPIMIASLLKPNNKVNLYAIFENDYQTLLDGCIKVEGLKIIEKKLLPLIYRSRTVVNFEPNIWSVLIDRIENNDGGIILKSNFNYNGVKFKDFLDFNINLKVQNEDGESEIITGKQYWRYDGIRKDISDRFIGVDFEIPKLVIKKLKSIVKYQIIIDDNYNNIVKRAPQFNGLLTQYNQLYKVDKGFISSNFTLEERKLELKYVTKKGLKEINKAKIEKMKEKSIPYMPRIVYNVAKPFLRHKKINIVGERGDTFQDNSSVFFKYCTSHGEKANTYFLAEKNSLAYKEAKKYGKVIKMNSLKHWLYLLNADNVITSYSINGYMLPKTIDKDDFLEYYSDICNYQRINLQHGVTYNNVISSMSRNRTGFNKIVVTNKMEEEYVKKSGYSEKELLKVGMPRFDLLPKKKDKIIKRILFIPTWRTGIVNKSYDSVGNQTAEKFIESDYYQRINNLLNNEKLNKLIESGEIEFVFKPHYEISEFVNTFTFNDNIKLKPEINVQQSLIDADLIITDYSSVFWDGIFMNKPVLYYQFDKEEFYSTHYSEGYIKFDDDRYGKVLEEEKELVTTITDYVKNGYENIDQNIRKELFEYYDGSSNQKIIDEIL